MGLVEWGTNHILDLISDLGYPGIVFLMALESACMPVPSEIVMPFAGYLVYDGSTNMSFWGVVLAGSLGCTVGSIAAYAFGFLIMAFLTRASIRTLILAPGPDRPIGPAGVYAP